MLDASALLAFLHQEAGAEQVQAILEKAIMSAVNWSEVYKKAIEQQIETEGLRADVEALGVKIIPFTPQQAEQAARLWRPTKSMGLSLGDRACLAVALEKTAIALTADRVWSQLELDIQIELIR